jgi:hemolysin activation/secretion protein
VLSSRVCHKSTQLLQVIIRLGRINRRWLQLGAVLGLSMVFFTPAMAVADLPSAEVVREQNQVIVQQEQQMRKSWRDLRRSKAPAAQIELQPALKEEAANPTCFTIKQIKLEGATLLSAKVQQRLLRPFVGRCLTLYGINNVVREVTNYYISLGYVTTRAYLGAQNLSQGVLVVQVFEGKLQRLNIRENQQGRVGLKNAFLGLQGNTLNIFDLEQGLDQINRLPSQTATMQIRPGKGVGESIVDVDVKRGKQLGVTAAVDNSGLPKTGRGLFNLTATMDDLFDMYDAWSFTYKQDMEDQSKQKMNRTLAAQGSVPLGYWLVRGFATEFEYGLLGTSELGFPGASTGKSRAYTLELERVLHRNGYGKTTLAGGLTAKEVLSYFADSLQQDQSRKLTIGTVRLGNLHRLSRGVLSSALTYNKGLTMLGALRDQQLTANTPRAQFENWQADAEYFQPLRVAAQSYDLDVRAHGQWAPHEMYSTEQLSIGGQYTVRGFLADSIIGDTGAYMRSELVWHVPSDIAVQANPFQQLDLFVGLDAGWIHKDMDDETERGSVSGMAMGIRAKTGMNFGELAVEHALHAPSFIVYSTNVLRFKLGVMV